ncbi:MAG: LapA family protein [bacterium]
MKKLLYVIVILVFFLFGLSIFYNNPQNVELKYYMGWHIELPLTVVLLITFGLGVIVGYFASLLKSLKLRRRLSKANKVIQTLEKN